MLGPLDKGGPILDAVLDAGRAVLAAEPRLRNRSAAASGYAPRPAWRPLTRFEQRGLKLGHGVWDIVFERC